jgi:DNA repair protein RadC
MNPYHKEELKQLFSACLRERSDSYTIQLLFEQFPTASELVNASEQQLEAIKGIGKSKARQINAVLELAKKIISPVQEDHHIIRSPKDVFNFIEPDLRYETKEHFICLFLNTKNRVITKEVISIGSLNATIVHPREVFRSAIKRCSASLICVHNHPSGDSTPSSEDIELTNRLVHSGKVLGIDVLDHIIIGDQNFVSLREKGLMEVEA